MKNTKAILAMTVALVTTPSFATKSDAQIAKQAANLTMEALAERGSTTEIDIEELGKLYMHHLAAHSFYQSNLKELKKLETSNLFRAREEAEFIKGLLEFPLFEIDRSGLLYSTLAQPTEDVSPSSYDDIVTFRISSHSRDDIQISEDLIVKQQLNKLPNGLARALYDLSVGGKRKYILPSWTMYGGSQSGDLLPYSTILATLELINITQNSVSPAH